MQLFRDLNKETTEQFRQWARENYKPGDNIKGIWHTVIQYECVKMNVEQFGGVKHENTV